MKYVKSTEGVGFPLRMDDLRYMHESAKEVIDAIGYALLQNSDPSYGLHLKGGFSFSGTTGTITEGYIYFLGEIFYVPAQSTEAPDMNYVGWYLEPEDVTEAYRVFKDGDTYGIHIRRQLKLVGWNPYNATIPDGVLVHTRLKKLTDVWLPNSNVNWTQPVLSNGYSNVSGKAVRWRKNKLGNIEIIGQFTYDSPGTSVLFTLPTGSRPTYEQRFTIFEEGDYQFPINPVMVTVKPDGTVNVSSYGMSTSNVYAICNSVYI